MKMDSCPHVCSINCTTHLQPSFQSLLQASHDALENLFSPLERLLCNGYDIPLYPTPDQLFFARIVGLVLSKLYVSNALLPIEKVHQVNSDYIYTWLMTYSVFRT